MVAQRDPAEAILAELEAIEDDLEGLTEAEFESPQEFADALLNNLPAITYALGMGLPVTRWRPAAKNANEAARVYRAIRQYGEGARYLILALVNGVITLDEFVNQMVGTFRRHARNSYMAGRRAVGNLVALTPAEQSRLEDLLADDTTDLQSWMDHATAAGGIGSMLASMFLSPSNYLGSGLPGDPFASLPPPIGAGKKSLKDLQREVQKYEKAGKPIPQGLQAELAKALKKEAPAQDLGAAGKKINQMADKVRSYSQVGELDGLATAVQPGATLVWWSLGAADHCIDCIRLSDGSPYYADMLATNGVFPGSGHTRCGGRCRCHFEYDVPAEVCTDPMSGAGNLGDMLIESTDGRVNVWVQEASTCRNPVAIDTLAAQLPSPTVTADETAFSWDEDLARAMKGGPALADVSWADVEAAAHGLLTSLEASRVRAVVGDPAAMAAARDWLRQILPGGDLGALHVSRYEVDGTVYHAFWQETSDAFRLELGATTSGLALLDPDFTLRAVSDLSQMAADAGKRLEINGAGLNDGMRSWLQTVGADRITLGGEPARVLPNFGQQRAIAARAKALAGIGPEQALADVRAHHPDVVFAGFDHPELSPKATSEMLGELDRLMTEYPQPTFLAVNVVEMPGRLVEVSADASKYTIRVNRDALRDPVAFAAEHTGMIDPTPAGMAAHEWGHVMAQNMSPSARAAAYRAVGEPVSRYARESVDEAYAERFAREQMTLRGPKAGIAPEADLAGAIDRWLTPGEDYPIKQAAIDMGGGTTQADADARALLRALDAAPRTNETLYRGIQLETVPKKGDLFHEPLGAWSDTAATAEGYADAPAGAAVHGKAVEGTPVVLQIDGGKALPIDTFGEYLSGGTFEVTGRQTEDGYTYVRLRQVETYSLPEAPKAGIAPEPAASDVYAMLDRIPDLVLPTPPVGSTPVRTPDASMLDAVRRAQEWIDGSWKNNYSSLSRPLATFTSGDMTVLTMYPGPTSPERKGVHVLVRAGQEPVAGGIWMDFPEPGWGITRDQYDEMDIGARAQLEAKEQATKWADRQYGIDWLNTYRPDVYADRWYTTWRTWTKGPDPDWARIHADADRLTASLRAASNRVQWPDMPTRYVKRGKPVEAGVGRLTDVARAAYAQAGTPDEIAAFRQYRKLGYYHVNSQLRGLPPPTAGTPMAKGEVDSLIARLDALTAAVPLPEDTFVYRALLGTEELGVPVANIGVDRATRLPAAKAGLEAKVGTTITNPSFISTTVDPNGWPYSVVMQMHVPEGTPAFFAGARQAFRGEQEVLLGRDLTYRIEGVTQRTIVANGKSEEQLVVRVEVLRPEVPKAGIAPGIDWSAPYTADQESVISRWVRNGNDSVINSLLRTDMVDFAGATDALRASTRRDAETLASAARPSPKRMTLHRGVTPEAFGYQATDDRLTDLNGVERALSDLVGKTYTDKGFSSGATERWVAEKNGEIRMHIDVPQGTPVIDVRGIGGYESKDGHEFILPPETTIRIKSYSMGHTDGGGVVWDVNAAVVPNADLAPKAGIAPEYPAWTNTRPLLASERPGSAIPMVGGKPVPVTTRTVYHVTTVDNAQQILQGGFDLTKVKPRWKNDYAVSTTPSSLKKAREYFMGRHPDPITGKMVTDAEMKGNRVVLQLKVRGRWFNTDNEEPFVAAGMDSRAYTSRMIAAGYDGADASALYVYNPGAILDIRAVGPEAEKLGLAPSTAAKAGIGPEVDGVPQLATDAKVRSEALNALEEFYPDGYDPEYMNALSEWLRGGATGKSGGITEDEWKQITAHVDRAFTSTHATTRGAVWRGTRDRGYTLGSVVSDPGYTFTTEKRERALDYLNLHAGETGEGVLLRYQIPEGMNALEDGRGDLILPRETKFRVTSIAQEDGVTVVHLSPMSEEAVPGIAPRALPEVDALPAWPDMGVMKAMPGTGGLGGTNHAKKLLVDPAGNHWLFRPGDEAVPEQVASTLADALGLRTPPMRVVEFGGEKGSLQPIIADAVSLTQRLISENSPGSAWSLLNDAQASEVMRQTVLDFVTANVDGHSGNWLLDSSDRLWGIDRSRAFAGAVATSDNVEAFIRQAPNIVSDVTPPLAGAKKTVFDAAPGQILPKIHPDVLDTTLARLDAMTDAEFAAIVRPAAGAVAMPFGTLDQQVDVILARKAKAREGFAGYFRTLAAEPEAPDEWKAWLKKGGTLDPVALPVIPETPVGPALMPDTGLAAQVPITYRSSPAVTSTAGNDLAVWQQGFLQASNRTDAIARLGKVLTGTNGNVLDGFTLEQLNLIVARAEHMKAMGVDMSRLSRLGDFTHVPDAEKASGIGLTWKGKITALDHEHRWGYLGGIDSPATVYNDIGGLFAHEYGHVVFGNLTATGQARVLDLYLRNKGTEKALSDYAAKDADEWFGEVMAALTTPGYASGTVTYDTELWGILLDDGIVKGVTAADAAPPYVKMSLTDWIAAKKGKVADEFAKPKPPPKPEWPDLKKLTKLDPQADVGPRGRVSVDGDGTRWLTKRQKAEYVDPRVEEETSRLAVRLGLNVNRIHAEPDLRTTVQKFLDGITPTWDQYRALTPEQIRELNRQWLFDALTANIDAHDGQFMLVDGKLVGIDKDVAFWGASTEMQIAKGTPEGFPEALATHVAAQLIDAEPEAWIRAVRPVDVQEMLARIDDVPKADLLKIGEKVQPLLTKDPAYDAKVATADMLVVRAADLRSQVADYYRDVVLNEAPTLTPEWRAWLREGATFDKGHPKPETLLIPDGPPKPAPSKAWFKPADAQQWTLPGSDLPLNSPLVEWSGKVPPEPPMPDLIVTEEQRAAAKAARDAAVKTWQDVLAGKVPVAFSWSPADAKAAEDAGLTVGKVGKDHIVANGPGALKVLQDYLDKGGRAADDDFWHLMGYSDRDLNAYDSYAALGKGMRATAGVVMVEPDGRVWIMAPRNEWAGYQNTHIKGGLDAGETAAEAAVREMREEAGFSVELDAYIGDYGNTDRTGITRMYVGHRTGGGPLWAKVKETYEVRLVPPDEAKAMLTRYKQPDARDQQILTDAVTALQGSAGSEHFVIPPNAVAELAAKTAPADTPNIWLPPPKSAGYTSPKPGIAPDPPVGQAFGWQHSTLQTYVGLETTTPASVHFPYDTTRWKLPNGETATMYAQVSPDGSLFWANSKKQITDPHTRLVLHAIQLSNLADRAVVLGATQLRVSEDLLVQVPKLRELLIAGGATGGKEAGQKALTIDIDALTALGNAVKNDLPLPNPAGHIPTAPITLAPVITTKGGAEAAKVSGALSTVTYTGPGVFTLAPDGGFGGRITTVTLSVKTGYGSTTFLNAGIFLNPQHYSPGEYRAAITAILAESAAHATVAGADSIAIDIAKENLPDELKAVWLDLGGKVGMDGKLFITTPNAETVAENVVITLGTLPGLKSIPDGMALSDAINAVATPPASIAGYGASTVAATINTGVDPWAGEGSIGDAAHQWVSLDPAPIIQAAASGFTGQDADLALAWAHAVADGETAPALHRGIVVPDAALADLKKLKSGDHVYMNLSSWSSDPQVAETYVAMQATVGQPVYFHLASGAKALDLTDAQEALGLTTAEWVTDGTLEVTSVVPVSGELHVYVEQKAPFAGPKEFAGLDAAKPYSLTPAPAPAPSVAATATPFPPPGVAGPPVDDALLDHQMPVDLNGGDAQDAMESYTGGAQVNASLLGDVPAWQTDDVANKTFIPIMDKWMADSATPTDMLLYRGAKSKPDLKVGELVGDPHYLSTSVRPEVGAWFALHEPSIAPGATVPTLYRIHAPKGSHAVWIGNHSLSPSEAEMLLPRGVQFRVVAVHEDVALDALSKGPWDAKGKARVVDLEPTGEPLLQPKSPYLTGIPDGPQMLPSAPAIAPSPVGPNPILDILDASTTFKATQDAHPLNLTTFTAPAPGGGGLTGLSGVTWRRLGNVLEIHATGGMDPLTAMQAMTVYLGKMAEQFPKITHLKVMAGFTGPDEWMAALKAAGATESAGGWKLERENLIALKDQILASAVATAPPTVTQPSGLLALIGLDGIHPTDWQGYTPILTPQKQGFTKVEWQVAQSALTGLPEVFATVRYRTMSSAIAITGIKADSDLELAIGTMRTLAHLADKFDADPALLALRWDDATALAPSVGLKGHLQSEYGLYSVPGKTGDVWMLPRDGLLKLRDDFTADIGTTSAHVAAAAPALIPPVPTMAEDLGVTQKHVTDALLAPPVADGAGTRIWTIGGWNIEGRGAAFPDSVLLKAVALSAHSTGGAASMTLTDARRAATLAEIATRAGQADALGVPLHIESGVFTGVWGDDLRNALVAAGANDAGFDSLTLSGDALTNVRDALKNGTPLAAPVPPPSALPLQTPNIAGKLTAQLGISEADLKGAFVPLTSDPWTMGKFGKQDVTVAGTNHSLSWGWMGPTDIDVTDDLKQPYLLFDNASDLTPAAFLTALKDAAGGLKQKGAPYSAIAYDAHSVAAANLQAIVTGFGFHYGDIGTAKVWYADTTELDSIVKAIDSNAPLPQVVGGSAAATVPLPIPVTPATLANMTEPDAYQLLGTVTSVPGAMTGQVELHFGAITAWANVDTTPLPILMGINGPGQSPETITKVLIASLDHMAGMDPHEIAVIGKPGAMLPSEAVAILDHYGTKTLSGNWVIKGGNLDDLKAAIASDTASMTPNPVMPLSALTGVPTPSAAATGDLWTGAASTLISGQPDHYLAQGVPTKIKLPSGAVDGYTSTATMPSGELLIVDWSTDPSGVTVLGKVTLQGGRPDDQTIAGLIGAAAQKANAQKTPILMIHPNTVTPAVATDLLKAGFSNSPGLWVGGPEAVQNLIGDFMGKVTYASPAAVANVGAAPGAVSALAAKHGLDQSLFHQLGHPQETALAQGFVRYDWSVPGAGAVSVKFRASSSTLSFVGISGDASMKATAFARTIDALAVRVAGAPSITSVRFDTAALGAGDHQLLLDLTSDWTTDGKWLVFDRQSFLDSAVTLNTDLQGTTVVGMPAATVGVGAANAAPVPTTTTNWAQDMGFPMGSLGEVSPYSAWSNSYSWKTPIAPGQKYARNTPWQSITTKSKHLTSRQMFVQIDTVASPEQRRAVAWVHLKGLATDAIGTYTPVWVSDQVLKEVSPLKKLLLQQGAVPKSYATLGDGLLIPKEKVQSLWSAMDHAESLPLNGATPVLTPPPASLATAAAGAVATPGIPWPTNLVPGYLTELEQILLTGPKEFTLLSPTFVPGVGQAEAHIAIDWNATSTAMDMAVMSAVGVEPHELDQMVVASALGLLDASGVPIDVWQSVLDVSPTLAKVMGGPGELKPNSPESHALYDIVNGTPGAPAAAPILAAAVPPPVPAATLSSIYGWDPTIATYAATKSTKTAFAGTPLTQVYQHSAPAGVGSMVVKWAEEQQGKARILRVRDFVTAGTAGPDQWMGAFLGILRGPLTDHIASTATKAERAVIDKKVVAKMPQLAALLKDGGWKETKDYWVIGGEDLLQFSEDLNLNKATTWSKVPTLPTAAPTAIPVAPVAVPVPNAIPLQAVPLGSIAGPTVAPKSLTPSFLYGYDPTVASKAAGTKIGTEAYTPKGGATNTTQADVFQIGPVKGTISTSTTGARVGFVRLVEDVGTTPDQKRDAAYALLRQAAEAGAATPKGFFVTPEVYDQVVGLRQFILDAGGTEANWSAIGTAVQMDPAAAGKLAHALATDTMGPITAGFGTTAEYLQFNATTFAEVIGSHPKPAKNGLEWMVAGKPFQMTVQGTADWSTGRIVAIGTGDKTYSSAVAAAQVYWLAQQGASRIEVAKAVLDEVPAMRQWLLAVGGRVDGGVIVLEGASVNNARRTLAKDALPVALGGVPLPPSVLDDLGASPDDLLEAATKHTLDVSGLQSTATLEIKGSKVTATYTRSDTNIHWSAFDRGTASVGEGRAAAAAQLRAFTNDLAQSISTARLDVAESVLKAQPGLRDVLMARGATQVPASGGQEAYLSLSRPQALKLRTDIDTEFAQLGAGAGQTFIQQQAAMIVWPSADELTFTGKTLKGQTKPRVFVDSRGNEWVFKPGHSGWGAVKDKVISELAADLGLPVPPARQYVLNDGGKEVAGSLQKMIPNIKTPNSLDDFTPPQLEQMLRHSVLDHLVNNDDAHIGNWLLGDDGTVWGIDKTRAYKSWHTNHDRLYTENMGNAYKPLIFEYFARIRADPTWLAKTHPNTISPVLRGIAKISDADFARMVRPIAEKTEDPRYAGKVDMLVREMVERKNAIVDDFERYFYAELDLAMKKNPAAVPADWKLWFSKGGHFNLSPNSEEQWREHLAVLEAKYGRLKRTSEGGSTSATRAAYTSVLAKGQFSEAKAVMDQFIDGGLKRFSPGTNIGGSSNIAGSTGAKVTPEMAARVAGATGEGTYAPNFIPLLTPQKQYEEWLEIQQWALLSIADGAPGPRSAGFDAQLREMWDPKTATFAVGRGSGRFATSKQAWEDLLKSQTKAAKSFAVPTHEWGGNKTFALVPYTNFISTVATDITRGEHEWIVRDLTPDMVVVIKAHKTMTVQQIRDWLIQNPSTKYA